MTMNETDNGSIVIVDDNPNNLQVLAGMLQQEGYKVRPALSGELALRAIAVSPPDLILLDIRMPGMDGYETCRRLKANPETVDIPVIFISALNENEDKLLAFAAGAVDYVSKPFQAAEVLARVRAQLQLYRMQQHLGQLVAERTAELRITCESLESSRSQYRRILEQTIQAIALTIEKRDPYTAGHQVRVSGLATAMAQEMGLDGERVEGLRLGGMIHHVEFPWPVAQMILQHHERLDGSGYPRGQRGSEILLEARILAVADVVEAMASHRPYRPAVGIDKALDEIHLGRGRLYDPDVVDVCQRLFRDRGYQLPHSLGN